MNSPLIPSLRMELQQLPPRDEVGGIEPLYIPVEWMRYCEMCESEQCFVARERCATGLICRCSKCGDERIAPFSRSNSVAVVWEVYT
jgi:hypothetical protein